MTIPADAQSDQQLALPVDVWRTPYWFYDLGYHRKPQIGRMVGMQIARIRRAQEDGIENVAPVLVALRADPADARRRFGKATWRAVHHAPLSLNVERAKVLMQTRIGLRDLIQFPAGALREALTKARNTSEAAVTAAGIIAKTRKEFREAVMLAHDTIRMDGKIDTRWSLRRLREEHDRLAMEWARAKSDPTPWGEPWSCQIDGYTFTLLNSGADFTAEGQVQRHCVASYAREAKARKYIVMKIEGRERATVRFGGHPVRVMEVRGRYNAAVSEACRHACAKVCAEHLESKPKEKP